MVRMALSDFGGGTVDLHPIGAGGSDGRTQLDPRVDRPAIVDERVREVTDQRADSETRGTTIASSGLVITYLEDYVKPGSTIDIRKGTPAARTATVVAAAYYDDIRAPEHAEMWLD